MRISNFDKSYDNDLTSEELATIYKRLFNSVDGQIILADLAQICAILQSHLTDEKQMYFLEGRKDIFFYIASQLKTDQTMPIESVTNTVINF